MLRCANAEEYQGHYYKRIVIHKLVSFLRFLINGFFKDYTIYFLKAQKSLFQKGKFHAYKRELNERTHICTKKSINNLELKLNFLLSVLFLTCGQLQIGINGAKYRRTLLCWFKFSCKVMWKSSFSTVHIII